MTRNVVTATPETSVDQVAALMLEHDISAVPIIDRKGAIVGLVSEGDLMRRVEGAVQQPKSWWLAFFGGPDKTASEFIAQRGRHARDIMTRDVETVAPDRPVGEIARLLEHKRIKRVPVVESGILVGLVSRANLLHALAATPKTKLAFNAGNREKRDAVLVALIKIPGLNPAHLNVVVEDGRVDVWGVAETDAEEDAVRVAFENIEDIGEISVNLGRVPNWAWGI